MILEHTVAQRVFLHQTKLSEAAEPGERTFQLQTTVQKADSSYLSVKWLYRNWSCSIIRIWLVQYSELSAGNQA